MTPLQMQTSRLGRHLLVTLFGEVDVTNSRPLVGRLILAVDQAAHRAHGAQDERGASGGPSGGRPFPDGEVAVIVHLSELDFMDAGGLSSLVTAAHAAQELGVGFVVAGARGTVARALRLGGLDEAAWLYPDLLAAVRALLQSGEPAPERTPPVRQADAATVGEAGHPSEPAVA
ncbi:STAS domain-containing protein [Spirillospora sp. NPDC050679]